VVSPHWFADLHGTAFRRLAFSSHLVGQRTLAEVYRCTYTRRVAQWDAEKAAANLKKHGVDFADAETALHDEMALTRPDDDPDEERFVTLGTDALGRLLVVVYEWRNDDWRLISARRATRAERRHYEGKR
jgi:uncharacterized DUF497 family protein